MNSHFVRDLGALPLVENMRTRAITAENFTGEKGRGGMADDGTGKACARDLGRKFKVSPSVNIAPGRLFTLAEIEGPGVIQSMWFGGDLAREYILRIYWDGQLQPSVECPISDFFAYGWTRHQKNPTDGPFWQLNSAVVMVNPNRAMNCYWQMPFHNSARVTIENRSNHTYVCYYQINYALTDVPENAGYFHAQMRQTKPVPYKGEHVLLDISGAGQYVGTAMFVGLNGHGNWWGEGEFKFFIDGDDEYPTICGTGTEDYFGGSYDWEVDGKYVTYSTPYVGMHQVIQADGLYSHQQRFSMYRWHVLDPICFERDLRATVQDLGWMPDGRYLPRQDDIATVSYWYQLLPTPEFPKLPDVDELAIY